MKVALILVLLVQSQILAASAKAAIVCEGKTQFGGSLKLTLEESGAARVVVTEPNGTETLSQDFPKTDEVWDGHMTGLVTAPGLSFKYENQYGCIRNVTITANVRGGSTGYIQSLSVPVCRGGSTRDELCIRP